MISLTARIGGYTKFISQGFNDNYLPVWLQQAGYNTYYTGKFMNGHGIDTYNDPFPKGFNQTNCKSGNLKSASIHSPEMVMGFGALTPHPSLVASLDRAECLRVLQCHVPEES